MQAVDPGLACEEDALLPNDVVNNFEIDPANVEFFVVDAVTDYVQRLAVKQHKGTADLEPAESSELKHSSGGTAAAQRSPTRRCGC